MSFLKALIFANRCAAGNHGNKIYLKRLPINHDACGTALLRVYMVSWEDLVGGSGKLVSCVSSRLRQLLLIFLGFVVLFFFFCISKFQ